MQPETTKLWIDEAKTLRQSTIRKVLNLIKPTGVKMNESTNEKTDKTQQKIEDFKRVAKRRTITVIKTLQLISNLKNANYKYSEDEIAKMFVAIEKQLAETKAVFASGQPAAELFDFEA